MTDEQARLGAIPESGMDTGSDDTPPGEPVPDEPLTGADRALLDDLRSREPQVVADEPERPPAEPPAPVDVGPDPLTPLFLPPPAPE